MVEIGQLNVGNEQVVVEVPKDNENEAMVLTLNNENFVHSPENERLEVAKRIVEEEIKDMGLRMTRLQKKKRIVEVLADWIDPG